MSVDPNGVLRIVDGSTAAVAFTAHVQSGLPIVVTASDAKHSIGRWAAFDKWRTATGLLSVWDQSQSSTPDAKHSTAAAAVASTAKQPTPFVDVLISSNSQFDGYFAGHNSQSLSFKDLIASAFSDKNEPPTAAADAKAVTESKSKKRSHSSNDASTDSMKRIRLSPLQQQEPTASSLHRYLCQCPIFTAQPLKHWPDDTKNQLPPIASAESPLSALLNDVLPLPSPVPLARLSSVNLWLSVGQSSSNLHYDGLTTHNTKHATH